MTNRATDPRAGAKRPFSRGETEEEFRGLLEAIPDAVMIISQDGKITETNARMTELFGYGADELIGRTPEFLVSPGNRKSYKAVRDELLKNPRSRPMILERNMNGRRKDGFQFPIEVRLCAYRSRGDVFLPCMIRDIGERKRLLGELQEEKARSRKYLDVADIMLVIIDREGTVNLINRKGCLCLGYESDEIIGKDWFEKFLPDRIRAETRRIFKKLMAGEIDPVEYYENYLLTRSGEERLIAWHNTTLVDEKGEITATLSSGLDITDRNQAEELRLHLASIVESSSDAILGRDLVGKIVSWNGGAERIYGYSAEEVRGRDVSILIPQDRASELDHISEEIRLGRRIESYETIRQRKDGKLIDVSLTVSPIKDSAGRIIGASAIARDITERKRMRAELQRNREFAALGEMAAAVAHQIKNPLAAVTGTVQVLCDPLMEKGPHRQVMEELLDRVTQLDQTVNRLLMFAKPWKPEKQVCNLRDVIQGVCDSAATRKEFEGIRFQLEGRDAIPVPVDIMLFGEVLWNLFHNAAEAMPNGGRIRIRFEKTARTATVTIDDTGSGIPKNAQQKLFHPFFSLKSRGTGLGLAICRKIMHAHGGTIGISSEPGRGAEVRLSLPRE